VPQFTIELPDGKRVVAEANDETAAMAGVQNWYAQNTSKKTDTSMTGALSEGASEVAQGVGKTIKHYINRDAGDAVLNARQVKSNPNYKSASEGFIHPEDGADNHTLGLDWSKLPRAFVEQAPAIATDVAGQLLLKKLGPIGSYLGNAITFGGRTAGGEAEKRALERTGGASSEPNLEDKAVGLGSTGAQAVLNQVGLNKIVSPSKVVGTGVKGAAEAAGNVGKAVVAEGATNAAQDLISQGAAKAGTSGLDTIDPKATLGAGVMGAVGGGVFSMPHAMKDTASAVRQRGQSNDEHTAMAANRVVESAGGLDKLKDPEAAGVATKRAIADVGKELSSAASEVTNPSQVAANAIDSAKRGEALSKRDLAAIDAEGNEALSSLARQATALSKLSASGRWTGDRFAGGVSEFVRSHAFGLGKLVGGVGALSNAAGHGAIGMDTLTAALPGAAQGVAAGYAGYKGLQAIDKMTGAYRPAHGFAEKFADGGAVRPDVPLNQSPTGPKVPQQNSVTTPQPWGPVADKPTAFKPDMLDSNLQKIVDKIQNEKRRDTAREAMPLLRQLAEQSKPPPEQPGIDANAMNEQVKSALLMAAARRKIEGQRQAEAEAAASPMIQEQGGLDEVRNPAMGKRANELISAANALARLRRVPEAEDAPPTAPDAPQPSPAPASPQAPRSMAEILQRLAQDNSPEPQPQAPRESVPEPEPFVLPESPHVFKEPKEAAEAIYAEAVAGGKEVRHPEGFKAGTTRRLKAEEEAYNAISSAMSSVKERGDFHKYLAALWGSDSPEIATKVRDQMLTEFPQYAETINTHLSDTKIKGLWTKPKKKK